MHVNYEKSDYTVSTMIQWLDGGAIYQGSLGKKINSHLDMLIQGCLCDME